MTHQERDVRLLKELDFLLNWLREQADSDTGLARVRAARAPYGQQAQRFDMLKWLGLIRFHGAGWLVLDFDHEVTQEDLLRRRRAIRTK